LLFEDGRYREASELLLDLAQVAGDVARNLTFSDLSIGTGFQELAINELPAIALSGRLGTAELANVERQLRLLDASFPRLSDTLLNASLVSGHRYLQAAGFGDLYASMGHGGAGTFGARLRAWRSLFSERLIMTDAFLVELDRAERAGASESKPWVEAQRICKEIDGEIRNSNNPLLATWSESLADRQMHLRRQRTRLRMLVVGTHYLATGEVLQLEDPFGGTLLHDVKKGTLKLWSVGPEGVDHGGKHPDIVMELER
jgi:hypothetical protein